MHLCPHLLLLTLLPSCSSAPAAPHPLLPAMQDVMWWVLYQAEGLLEGSWLRRKALSTIMEHIHYEDENTRYVDIGPVNKVVNMLACWLEDPNGEAFKK